MGTWGTGLFQDDTACEVRDDYVKNLKAGDSDAEATRKILASHKSVLGNVQIATSVYLALADTQWSYGRLEPAIRKRALDLIRRGADRKQWKEDAPDLVQAREKVLAKLAQRLTTRPKSRRIIKVVKPRPLTTWTDTQLGTVFLLPLSKTSFAALVLAANIEVGYRRKDPMFVATDIVIAKRPRDNGQDFCTGRERIAALVDAGITGRRPPLTEWERKFGKR